MSPAFIKQFKSENRCWSCTHDRAAGYAFCRPHLLKARRGWQLRQIEHRKLGLCCNCNRKSAKTRDGRITGRCSKHRASNLARTTAWHAAHPEYRIRDVERLKAWIQHGRCPKCKEHRPLPKDGGTRCVQCRARHNGYKNGTYIKPPTTTIRPYSDRWTESELTS
jgi:hypothetical protein